MYVCANPAGPPLDDFVPVRALFRPALKQAEIRRQELEKNSRHVSTCLFGLDI